MFSSLHTAIVPPSLRDEIRKQYTKFVHILRLRHLLYSSLILADPNKGDMRRYYRVISMISGIMLIWENAATCLEESDIIDEYNFILFLLDQTNINISKWLNDYNNLDEIDISDWTIRSSRYREKGKDMVQITFDINPGNYYVSRLSKYMDPGTLYFDPGNRLIKGVEIKLTYRKYQSLIERGQINSDIIDTFLSANAQKPVPFDQRGLIEVLRLLLRYNGVLFDSSHFISACHEVWTYIKDKLIGQMNIELVEGFACPFNNNFHCFCSLYPQDKVFGGMDDFFSFHPGTNSNIINPKVVMTINPPFVESILKRAGDRIIYWLEHIPNFTAVLLWPYWIDQDGKDSYDEIALSRLLSPQFGYRMWTKIMRANKYNIWLPMTQEAIPANFDCILLLVSNDLTCPISPNDLYGVTG